MGRFIFSNDRDVIELICNCFRDKKIQKIDSQLFNLKERNIKNFVKHKDGCILGYGTWIYKNKTGSEALEKIYTDFFLNENLSELFKHFHGSFFIILVRDNVKYFFTDYSGFFKVYVYNKNDIFNISDTQYHAALPFGNSITIDKNNLVENSFQHSNLYSGSLFNEVYSVKPGVIYKLEKNSINEFRNLFIQEGQNLVDDVAIQREKIVSDLKSLSHNLKRNFSNIAINMTGGLDSRLVLSSLLNVGIHPDLIYGKGNSPLTNTKRLDLEINEEYAEKFELNLQIMDWSDSRLDNKFISYLNELGEYSLVYGGNKNIIEEYKLLAKKHDLILMGYYGETYRNVEWLEKFSAKKEWMNIDEFIEKYIYNYDVMSQYLIDFKSFRNHIKKKLLKILSIHGINPQNINLDDFQKIHNYYRASADTKMVNFINKFGNSIVFLGEPALQETIVNVKQKNKANAKFMLSLINSLCKEILSIPVFSHIRVMHFDVKKQILSNPPQKNPSQKNLKEKVKRLLKLVFPIAFIRKTLKLLSNSSESEQHRLRTVISSEVVYLQTKLNLKLVDVKKYSGDIRALNYYLNNLKMIDVIFSKQKQNSR